MVGLKRQVVVLVAVGGLLDTDLGQPSRHDPVDVELVSDDVFDDRPDGAPVDPRQPGDGRSPSGHHPREEIADFTGEPGAMAGSPATTRHRRRSAAAASSAP